MKIAWAAIIVVLLGSSPATAAADELCGQLMLFENDVAAARPRSAQFFDIFWGVDDKSLWSVGCKHSKTEGSKRICSWLPTHMSLEFPGMLPKRISACYGDTAGVYDAYKFPRKTTQLRPRSGNRLTMQTGNVSDMPWLRLTVIPPGTHVSPSLAVPAQWRSSSAPTAAASGN